MWKDFFSSIGINSVTVDTTIKQKDYSPGDIIHGTVHIKGGQAEEPIEKIQLLLYMQYEEVKEDSDFNWHDKHVEEQTIEFDCNVKEGETIDVPFSFTLPKDSAPTDEKHKWFIKTKVFIEQAVDPEDEDEVIVK